MYALLHFLSKNIQAIIILNKSQLMDFICFHFSMINNTFKYKKTIQNKFIITTVDAKLKILYEALYEFNVFSN